MEIDKMSNAIVGNEIKEIMCSLNPNHHEQLQGVAKESDLTTNILNWLGYCVHPENDETIAESADDSDESTDGNFDEEFLQTFASQLHSDDEANQSDPSSGQHKKAFGFGPINLNDVVPINHVGNINSNERNLFKQQIIDEIKKSDIMSDSEARATDVNELCPNDRWKLYRLWLKLNAERIQSHINKTQNECRSQLLSLTDLNNQEDIEIAKKAKIIGITTTGAAKNRHIIVGTKPKITSNNAHILFIHMYFFACATHFQNHIQSKKSVSSKDDFRRLASDGGCQEACGSRMPCGHTCEKACHVIDHDHIEEFRKCDKPCDAIVCELNHRCSKKCHDGKECGKCNFLIKKLHPGCQHMLEVACSQNPSSVYCYSPCKKTRPCGHKCKNLCSAVCNQVLCNEQVHETAPCGHKVVVKCSQKANFLNLLDACQEPCRVELKCGHICEGSCGKCRLGRLHVR